MSDVTVAVHPPAPVSTPRPDTKAEVEAALARDCTQMLRLSFFRTLSTAPRWPLFHRVVRGVQARRALAHDATVADVFGHAYDLVAARGGNAYTVAVEYFVLLQRELGEALLYAAAEPSCLPHAIGDYLVVTRDRARMVEIKSGRDSFARLPHQLAAYQGAASDVDLVVDGAHLEAARVAAPGGVGLVRTGGGAHRVRQPTLGAATWQSLPIAYLGSGSARHAARFDALARAAAARPAVAGEDLPVEHLPPTALHAALVESLAERGGEFPLASDRGQLPPALWPIALSLRASARDCDRILSALNQRALGSAPVSGHGR